MANVQRLTKRVKDLEEWTKENEMTGGPQGILETFNFLVNETRMSAQLRINTEQSFNGLRSAAFEFIQQHELTDEWNEFLKEKNAVQKQSPEALSFLQEAPPSKEVDEEVRAREELAEESENEEKDET